jgi:hypothetical protein
MFLYRNRIKINTLRIDLQKDATSVHYEILVSTQWSKNVIYINAVGEIMIRALVK